MQFPYGIADFRKIREGGYFYVDRTDRIALVENAGSQLLLLRPRRFGKSLWLSTLEMIERFYTMGELGPLCELIEQRLQVLDNRDLRWSNKLVVKMTFLALLFDGAFYVMDSEPTLADAAQQLGRYRQALERTYGERLRLRTHTVVVCLGLERLVWT